MCTSNSIACTYYWSLICYWCMKVEWAILASSTFLALVVQWTCLPAFFCGHRKSVSSSFANSAREWSLWTHFYACCFYRIWNLWYDNCRRQKRLWDQNSDILHSFVYHMALFAFSTVWCILRRAMHIFHLSPYRKPNKNTTGKDLRHYNCRLIE